MYLDDLLEEVFQDKETPNAILRKYDLVDVLEKTIQSISKELNHSAISITRLVGLAPSVLFLINNRLAKITNQEDKKELEFLMAEVTNHLIKKLLAKCDQPATALKEIKVALETASDINAFNFGALLQILKYDNLEVTYKEDETYWYDWCGKLHELDGLAEKLRRHGLIKSVKDFKELFKAHGNAKLKVQFSKDSVPFLIALFDELKIKGLIIPRGGTGHFHPLKIYGMTFENKVLIKGEPKSIKRNTKRKPEKWERIENKAKDLVTPIAHSITSRSPRVRLDEITRTET